jgi:Tol biopolymer transport system component/predicted Ser/Thr protein kinase
MIGRTLAHYRIIEKLGEGGMGEVYRAHDEKLDRDVALKVLLASALRDETARARLLREARSAAALNHPHICTVHEVGEADGQTYIAMEFVEGKPLSESVRAQGLPVETALRYGSQIADGLGHAHERGVVHRDLKSANVVITSEGRAKVLDFGLAKRLEGRELSEVTTQSQGLLTQPGAVMGTLPYMAPEQLRGEPADARSDVWALGVVLHEMLVGERPFKGQTGYELSSAILNQPPPPLPAKVPVELRAVIEQCLAKEPARRYQRAGEVRAALDTIQSGVVAPWPAWPYRSAWRRWWLAVAAGVVVVGVLAAAYVVLRTGLFQAPSPSWTLKPLTSFVGMEWGATLSPDASFVAYAHNKYGHMDIFVLSTGGGDPIRLTDSPADELTPRWSPDGRYIAFLADRGTGTNVYLIPALGGAERKLAETHISWLEQAVETLFALGAAPWSPDATELLFSRLQPTGEIAVWRINLSTGVQTQLTRPPPGAVDHYATWSFDGERIAFTRNQGGKQSLWLMDAPEGPSASLGASEPELLLGDDYVNMTPAWSADGQRLVFISNRSGPLNLWEIEVGSRRLRQVTSGAGAAFLPTISSTGPVAYTQYSHQVDLYWGPVDRPQEAHQRLTTHTFNNFNGRVSLDGQQVVYSSDRTGNYELWLLDRRTGAERQLTDHPGWDTMPDWSPDGREIVFLSNREGALQPWVLEVDSGRARRVSEKSRPIPFEPHFGGPRWSPDGKAIGFIAAGEKEEALWVVDPQGRNERPVLSGVIGFDWYRDSRHVVYTGRASDGTVEMRVADLETGKEALLLRGPSAELVVAPDGRGVAYLHSASHFNMQLHLLRLAPPASPDQLPRPLGEPQQLTSGESAWHVHNGGWSPDSKAVVYTRDLDRGDIYVIENYR